MAKNDKVLIDGIIDERIELKLPSDKRDEAFEYFAFEQILKDYDLSSDEITQGSVDGRNDGGIDGFFIFVNGHLLSDPETFVWPKSGSILEVWIITCKLHDTFRQPPLDNLVASAHELFDFALESSQLKGDYSEKVISLRENLKLAYRKVSPRLSQFSIDFCYASRGNVTELGESILSRSEQLTQIAKDAFGNCLSKFAFIGSTELIELNRKARNFTLELPIIKDLSNGENYILLVKLKDYYNFIQDKGKLRRYLFDSNVRAFMGLNRVNEDIRSTLANTESPDFWWLNNGITILATHAFIIGEIIHIEDIQIVNGLQTSESIFRHFENGGTDPNNRTVLVKVLVSNDEKVRDTIIRATNNQTTVELSSLHATDKIQRDIEDILKQREIYYERRTNFYKNQGIAPDKIVTPLYIAAGFVNLILKAPDQASRLKSKFMRLESSYEKVFSQSTDLKVWPQIAILLKNTDLFLETVRPSGKGNTENFLKSRRQVLSFLTVSKILGKFDFSTNDLVNFDISKYTQIELQSIWVLVKKTISQINNTKVKKSAFIELCKKVAAEWNIKGIERLIHIKEVVVPLVESKTEEKIEKPKEEKKEAVTLDFAMKINELLPDQPWKPGIHLEICEKMNCSKASYFEAVKLLIEEGVRHTQKDGVVYDEDGNVISFDKERVDEETLKLKDTN
jgi:AIPR protein